jgi:hypothetical protein
MPISLPDAYVSTVSSGIAIQGATQRCIDYLKATFGVLVNGTIALIADDRAEEVFEAMDVAGLHTITLG